MPGKRLNHIVLYVSDPAKSAAFYGELLDLKDERWMGGKAYNLFDPASPTRHDLALYPKNAGMQRAGIFASRNETPGAQEPPAGLYHSAWEVESLAELERVRDLLEAQGRLGLTEDHGIVKSVYGHDPDGLLFEVMWVVPEHLVREDERKVTGLKKLDFAAEWQRLRDAKEAGAA